MWLSLPRLQIQVVPQVAVGQVLQALWFKDVGMVRLGLIEDAPQCVHFRHYAPEPKEYAVNRYDFEAWRHWKIVDQHLATRTWMLGDTYTLVDMALWGWARMVPFILGDDAWAKLPNLKRLHDEIDARPAAGKAKTLKDRFPFKTDFDAEARRHMFKHIA